MFTLLSVKILIYNNAYSTLIVTRIILRPLSALSLDIAKRNIMTGLFGLPLSCNIFVSSMASRTHQIYVYAFTKNYSEI